MRQKLLLLKLAFKLAGMFLVDFYKVLRSEIADKTLYPQEKYSSCLERATAMVMDAMKRPLSFFGCSIGSHRFMSHQESHYTEVKELEKDLTVKEAKYASRGFWQI